MGGFGGGSAMGDFGGAVLFLFDPVFLRIRIYIDIYVDMYICF